MTRSTRPDPRALFLSRRALLRAGLGAGFLAACGGRPGPADALAPTAAVPDDGDDDAADDAAALDDAAPLACTAPTADNIEGPFFKPGAPSRSVLVAADTPGERLAVGGLVTSTDCRPLGDVRIQIWHADHRGAYDNDGFTFRGALRSDADGRWDVRTILPGRYLNGRRYRPAHLHLELRAAGHRPLTTQLYFDGDPYNDGDPFLVPSLIMPVERTRRGARARFDFVLEPA